ncbi:hypothetical protein AS034_19640 [[Bacillus] enclensis]|uniref:Nuclease-related domain-containing protein n=1 Tax=[Bacillus] enclensis TaxID=1402860 RepID=A0A0V8H893_9BACI|nr:nuclease-related domain-containing protein [[Bacillus] enclensis]KSU58718.1 hypothetical protein AS034_19640 [[Bacillus] enclensis]SCC33496.1 Nuclease-related domain-containing protein [[Bacillus] enclensis]
MNVNERKIPRIILKLEALHGRLNPLNVKITHIKEDWNKRLAGYRGEVSLDYVLGFLDAQEYVLLHGVRLEVDGKYFQIDTLVLSRKLILILEVKNLAGTIYFDQVFNQLIQLKDGQENSYPDPLVQISRQERQLKRWIEKNNLPRIPIHSLVVISNDKTLIKTSSNHKFLSDKVIHKQILPTRINQLTNSVHKEAYSEKEFKKFIRIIKKKHEESDPSILERYKITGEEILTGVICEICNFRPLIRMHGSRYCSKCQHSDKQGHLRALIDYELLLGPELTNKELKRFLNISSRHVSLRILKSLNLPTTGTKKSTTYDLTQLTKQNVPTNSNKKPATTK